MRTIRTADAIGAALDWLVWGLTGGAKRYPRTASGEGFLKEWKRSSSKYIHPSTDWEHGGPIIEREKIAVDFDADPECGGPCAASRRDDPYYWVGSTPLIAAMRCYVASKLGETVEVPEELL